MSWATQIETITLFVDELQTSKAFYLQVFDTSTVFEDADSAVFKIGGLQVNLLDRSAATELVEPASVAASANDVAFVITLPVDDVDVVAADLILRGATLLNGPIDRPWGVRTASFRDPSGYVWEIAS
jgi:uncharacterized glyoxalase superfamily protein PhnB